MKRLSIEARKKKVQATFDEMDEVELEGVVAWLLKDDCALPHLERALRECGYEEEPK